MGSGESIRLKSSSVTKRTRYSQKWRKCENE
ncbi:hypothetical protein RUMTOR_01371 [[Ruminococcus] torques ATCC 27756]|uniref:Uncharacterized protein n=1 Tax=[Ruminococcus] torques ATCC 27756 TaxID=411460 RepID=A5KMA7_9FIRM|nr:hypothetical protein RUMTOR_01371 [[Ruminococcus] torques ATCC 27756]